MRDKERLDSIPVVGEDTGPGVDGLPHNILYDDRSPRDVVLSGPLGKKVASPGRWFATTSDALSWAREKYGEENVRLIYPTEGNESARWAVLVKNLRN